MKAAELGIKFFETSALSGLNVEEAFLTLTRDILYKVEVRNGKGGKGGGGECVSEKWRCREGYIYQSLSGWTSSLWMNDKQQQT